MVNHILISADELAAYQSIRDIILSQGRGVTEDIVVFENNAVIPNNLAFSLYHIHLLDGTCVKHRSGTACEPKPYH